MKINMNFLIISLSVLLRKRLFQAKAEDKLEIHIIFSINFSLGNRAVCEIMWNNTVQPNRPQVTIWRMLIACWITKATNTLLEYVILIAFLLQQRFKSAKIWAMFCFILFGCFINCIPNWWSIIRREVNNHGRWSGFPDANSLIGNWNPCARGVLSVPIILIGLLYSVWRS